MVREFAVNEVEPLAADIDKEHRFPVETVEKMAKYGLLGIPFPTQYGGAGGDHISYAITVEELSRVCASTGVICSAHTSLCCWPIFNWGNEEQKMKYLPDLLSGKIHDIDSFILVPEKSFIVFGFDKINLVADDDRMMSFGKQLFCFLFYVNLTDVAVESVTSVYDVVSGINIVSFYIQIKETVGCTSLVFIGNNHFLFVCLCIDLH